MHLISSEPKSKAAKAEPHSGWVRSTPAIGTTAPDEPGKRGYTQQYREWKQGGFAEWRLSVEGAVERPGSYSLAELKRL